MHNFFSLLIIYWKVVILKDRDFYCFCKSVLYKVTAENKNNLKLFYSYFFLHNGAAQAYINHMFKSSSSCINTKSKLVIGILLERTKDHLFFVGPKK